MTEPVSSGQLPIDTPSLSSHGAPGEGPYFPADEWQRFRVDDTRAGTILICLMGGIFLVGLILYLIVLTMVKSGA